MELLTIYHFLNNFFFPFSLVSSFSESPCKVTLAVEKLLPPEHSQSEKDHHTLTLMPSKGEEIKITVPCDNWQSDTEMAREWIQK